MFFNLIFIPSHPIYQLQSAIECFFRHCITATEFEIECFPKWFRPVVEESNVLRGRFERIAEIIGRQDLPTRTHIFEVFKNNNQVQILCEDTSSSLLILDAKLSDLHDEVKDLFEHLYDKTTNTKVFRDSAKGRSVKDHYEKFREKNDLVCPFCSSQYYPGVESGTRASYDHYLKRTIYPFAAVNFKNLVPMCEICNGPTNKGTKDILFTSPARKKRRQVFFPYSEYTEVRLDVRCTEKPSISNKGRWNVATTPKRSKDVEKVDTWNAVFNVNRRLKDRLREQNRAWLLEFIGNRFEYLRKNITTFRKGLRSEATKLSDLYYWRNIQDSVLKSYFYSYLANDAKTEVIQSYCDIAKTRYIAKTASRGASLNK